MPADQLPESAAPAKSSSAIALLREALNHLPGERQAIPVVSVWGMLTITLLVLTTGTLVLMRCKRLNPSPIICELTRFTNDTCSATPCGWRFALLRRARG